MNAARAWHVIFVVAAACTCGARTECSEIAQISLLTSLHDDPSCAKPSIKGVMLYEAAGLLAEAHNNRTDYDFDIEITVFDTCDSITGALKAAMKALVWADINCLHPPHYLGIIGPDTATNAEAVHKVTSILKVPHIVKKASISPYLHPLAEESNSYMVQAILKTIEILRWRSFTLVANVDDENDDAQNIAKELTMSAIARNLCVIVRDNDEEDYTSHIVHIGKQGEKFLRKSANATVLIVDNGDGKDHLNRINSSNTVLLLEDFRNVIDGLERRVENSRWWTLENDSHGRYDAEKLRQVRWLKDAVEIYTRAAKTLCKNKKCKNQINPLDWNHVVSSVLMAHNAESQAAPRFLDLSMRTKTGDLKRLGGLIVHKGKAKVYWGERTNELSLEEDEIGANDDTTTANSYEDMPLAFRGLLNRKNESRSGCVTAKEITMPDEKDKRATQIHVLGMDDNEWWTMVYMVSSIGVAMFVVGIFAVYVIYKNIQNPRCPKGKDQLSRDTSLRRMGSEREPPTTITSRNQRALRMLSRMDSNRSNVSEKSV